MLLKLLLLFFVGSILGWLLELVYRRFFSAKRWINPGFLIGPYVPLYGFGLCILYFFTTFFMRLKIDNSLVKAIVCIISMGILLTLIEFLAGLIFIKGLRIKLWDYRNSWGNIMGIICPLFSIFWTILAALYYLLIHQHLGFLNDIVNYDITKIFIGFMLGVMSVDLAYTFDLSTKLRQIAKEYKSVITYEHFKNWIAASVTATKKKYHFILPFKSDLSFRESIKAYLKHKKEDDSSK